MKKMVLTLAVALATVITFETAGQIMFQGQMSFVSRAEAIIGRPLTPISYAGVARRTVRRCAAFC
ncbi:MAG: hypothetical protein E5V74_02685 [Mesorhizobium sp.]|nr:MAG: hypothetical protein E5W03_01515 [Mesorhizobium sp.]TIV24788.1 MAG: hypothetical protein E5W02_01955 [Mesorhizobium sp.]TIV68063.1 MAG: hypothetical protein E5V86_02390 [Mesorhizobium sp.]TIW05501.1 MAG: hypothetical protein E5V74_02685 [Mesorhizobium sp.]